MGRLISMPPLEIPSSKPSIASKRKTAYPTLYWQAVKLGTIFSGVRHPLPALFIWIASTRQIPPPQGQAARDHFFRTGVNHLITPPSTFKSFDPAWYLALNQRNKTAVKSEFTLDHPTLVLLYLSQLNWKDAMEKIRTAIEWCPRNWEKLNYDELQSTNELSLLKWNNNHQTINKRVRCRPSHIHPFFYRSTLLINNLELEFNFAIPRNCFFCSNARKEWQS